MKTFKNICIIVLSVLLILSVAFNIFILTIFEIWTPEKFKELLVVQATLEDLKEQANSTLTPNPEPTKPESTIAFSYADAWITVTELKQGVGIMGPTITINIENISNEAVRVSFVDLSIDGYISQYSSTGVYAEILDPGMKAIRDISLCESDYEAFTSKPEAITFTIEVIDLNTYGTLASEEATIYIN